MIKPLHDNVLLEQEKISNQTKSGIILKEEKENPSIATVLEVGDGITLDNGTISKPKVKKGDKVVFKKYSTTDFEYEDKKYYLISEKDILAVIE